MPHTSLTVEEAISVAIERCRDHGGFKNILDLIIELFIKAKKL